MTSWLERMDPPQALHSASQEPASLHFRRAPAPELRDPGLALVVLDGDAAQERGLALVGDALDRSLVGQIERQLHPRPADQLHVRMAPGHEVWKAADVAVEDRGERPGDEPLWRRVAREDVEPQGRLPRATRVGQEPAEQVVVSALLRRADEGLAEIVGNAGQDLVTGHDASEPLFRPDHGPGEAGSREGRRHTTHEPGLEGVRVAEVTGAGAPSEARDALLVF